MKIKSIQFVNMVHLAGEPLRHLLVNSPVVDKVEVKETGVEITRKDKFFFVPKHNITCIEYEHETATGISKTKQSIKGKKAIQRRNSRGTTELVV